MHRLYLACCLFVCLLLLQVKLAVAVKGSAFYRIVEEGNRFHRNDYSTQKSEINKECVNTVCVKSPEKRRRILTEKKTLLETRSSHSAGLFVFFFFFPLFLLSTKQWHKNRPTRVQHSETQSDLTGNLTFL